MSNENTILKVRCYQRDFLGIHKMISMTYKNNTPTTFLDIKNSVSNFGTHKLETNKPQDMYIANEYFVT